MAVTLATSARNASVDARTALVNSGTLRIRAGSTTLGDITLDSTAFAAASTGSASASGFPKNATASASGTADNYQVLNSSATLVWSGSVTATGGGGDLQLSTTSIASGATITISSWSHSQPAS